MVVEGRELVDELYEAAIVPELWTTVLQKICRTVGTEAAALLTVDETGRIRYAATDCYRPALENWVVNGTAYENVRPSRALALHPHSFAVDLDVCQIEEIEKDPIYLEFLHPYGWGWTAGTAIASPTGDLIVVDLARRRVDGPFDRALVARLNSYWPHLARASLLAQRFSFQAARAATDAMLAVRLPAACVTDLGQVIAANTAFEDLTPRIKVGAGDRISVSDPYAARLLKEALVELSRSPGASSQSILIRGDYETRPLVLHVVPIRLAAHDIFARSSAFLVATPVTGNAALPDHVLIGLFDLTSAEAKVARGVANGLTIDEMAARSGLSRETIRTQLKSVMGKTGTTRQAQLALLMSGTSPA